MNNLEKNAAAYDKICERWSRIRDKSPINLCVVRFAELLEKNCRVLDVGCGTGCPIDVFLTEQGFSVVGIDVSPKMIEKARALGLKNAHFLTADAAQYFSEEKFGGVVAFDSLWHLPQSRQEEVYRRIAAMLVCGGYFLFTHGKTAGSAEGEMFGEKFFYNALDASFVKEILEGCGMKILSMTEDYREETTGHRELLVVAKKII
ncbi:MAG: class I SAM-dependent methyltransferase [Christensenellales bacterium]